MRELGAAAVAAAIAYGAASAVGVTGAGHARWVAAGGVAGALAAMQVALVLGRRRRGVAATGAIADGARGEATRYLDQRVTGSRRSAAHPLELAPALEELLARAAALGDARIYGVSHDERQLIALVVDDGGPAGDREAASVRLDRRARAWLLANPRPIDSGRLAELPLGGLRQPIEELVGSLGGDLVLPLVHRGQLVGLATARGNARRALRGPALDAVQAAQDATASALAELRLRAAEAERSQVEREVERAGRVQIEVGGGSPFEEVAGWQVERCFAAARQFSGAWWTTAALPGPRLLVGLGEVTGRGVPAALLSASAVGAVQAASRMLGTGFEPDVVLELIHRSVRQAGGGAYQMSALVAVVDARARAVSFAGAGHPFPYVWRAGGGELGALVSRGNLLGGEEPPIRSSARRSIERDEAIVFYSASATDARSPEGEPFGERRLRRALRQASDEGGPATGLATWVAAAVRAHVGDGALEDDLLVATVAAVQGR